MAYYDHNQQERPRGHKRAAPPFSWSSRKPRPRTASARIEQPIRYKTGNVVPLRSVDYRIKPLAAEDHFRDLIRAQPVRQVIDGEAGTAIATPSAEFIEQRVPS
jgi:hypothetical protein